MFALCRCTAHKHPITALICRADGQQYYIAISVSIRLSARMGALKTQVLENACTENASTMQTFSQIKKSLVLHHLVWCIFKWGGKVDYRLFFSEIT